MNLVLFSSFLIQAFAMFFDEFYFHHKRRLPQWEKLGHPLDSLSVLICYIFLIFNEYSEQNMWIYVGLCVFSTLLITKDEFIHTEKCEARENWLHSLLFVIHPIVFLAAGVLWFKAYNIHIFYVQAFLVFLFMVYQIFYWNVYDKRPS